MARNAPAAYGVDIACLRDADALFTPATGLDVVIQSAFHRLTTDSVLGPGGDGWGFDCRRLLGMRGAKLAAMQPMLSEVLTRDERIETADVTLTAVRTNGLDDVRIEVTCATALGPFTFVRTVIGLTTADFEAQT